jgi:tetrahydromethanopterin S-methyltransferase subunit H
MAWDWHRTFGSNREETGQASLMMLAVIGALLAGTLVLSGLRSDAEQAVLFAAQPMPHLFSALLSHSRAAH